MRAAFGKGQHGVAIPERLADRTDARVKQRAQVLPRAASSPIIL